MANDPNAPGTPDTPDQGGSPNWWKPLAQIGGGAAGMYFGRQAQQQALQRSPEETAAINNVMGPGGAQGVANSLMGESRPYISQPASYYRTLMNGNRAAMAQVTAPQRAALTDSYRGAQAGLNRSGIRGAARDVLAGDLNRQQASQTAGLTTGVQPAAAAALAGLGQNLQSNAVPLYGSANNFYAQLLNNGLLNRQQASKEGADTGKEFGQLISRLGDLNFGGGKKKTTPPPTPGGKPWTPPGSTPPPEFPEEGEGEGGFGPVAAPPVDYGDAPYPDEYGPVAPPPTYGSTGDGGNWFDPQG